MSQDGINKKTGLEQLSDWVFMITGLMVFAITILVSYDVLMRYFLDEPQLFVDDLTSFLLVAIIFLGAGPVFYKGGHIRVDLLISHLKFKSQKKLRLITLIIGIIFLGIVTYQTMISTITAFQTGRVSAVMNYPLWIGMSFIPIGSILLLLYILVDLVNVIKEKSNKNKV